MQRGKNSTKNRKKNTRVQNREIEQRFNFGPEVSVEISWSFDCKLTKERDERERKEASVNLI